MLRSRGRLSGLKKPHQDYLSESLQRFSSKNELNESDDLNSLKLCEVFKEGTDISILLRGKTVEY
jgi:hypothetical protein